MLRQGQGIRSLLALPLVEDPLGNLWIGGSTTVVVGVLVLLLPSPFAFRNRMKAWRKRQRLLLEQADRF